MALQEAFTLDGLALNDQTTLAIDGNKGIDMAPPRQRQDWVGAADSETQLLMRKPLHENRKIILPMVVIQQASMDLVHDKIALIVDKLQKASLYEDGIALTWTPATGTRTVTFDVLAGEIPGLPVDVANGWLALSPEFSIELTCKPYWRGTETLTSTASSSTPFVTKEITGVTGDVPALGRLIVTDTATQSRRHVEWGIEGLYYNSGTSLLVDSDDMVTSGFSGTQVSTGAGAYDPNATGNSSIKLAAALNATTALAGTGNLSHVGTFKVKARMWCGLVAHQARLSWRAGDGPMNHNAWVSPVVASNWCELDLGTITVPTATLGTQRWTGQVEVQGGDGAQDIYLDYLVLIPQLEGYGKARGAYAYTAGVVSGYDAFTSTTAGNALNTRTAPLGGSWATSGDTTDFTFSDNGFGSGTEEASRATSVVETTGRYAILGSTNYTDTQVDVSVGVSTYSVGNIVRGGAVARWTDANNHIRAEIGFTRGSSYTATLAIQQVVTGTTTQLTSQTLTGWNIGTTIHLRLLVFASGRIVAQALTTGGVTMAALDTASAACVTGGALQTGKPGFVDRRTSGTVTRYYDDFSVSIPSAEPIAVYSGRTMQIRYDDVLRDDSTGTYAGRPPSYRGSRFLVPVGTSRVLVKARRNDVDVNVDDQVTDATQIQIGWTPRGLAVPRS